MVVVGTYPTRSDAELAQTALTAAGIPSVVDSDTPAALTGSTCRAEARPLVDEADAEEAAAILAPPGR